MEKMLCILSTQGTSYNWVVVGWVYSSGDDIMVEGCRVIKRFGNLAQLAVLAEKGPQKDTQLLEASTKPERFWRPHVHRWIECNAESWVKECPKPK